MILILIINYSMYFIAWVITLLPALPTVPDTIVNSLDTIFNVIGNNIHLLNLFVPLQLLLVLLPVALAISQASLIWSLVLWVYKHLPVVGKGN